VNEKACSVQALKLKKKQYIYVLEYIDSGREPAESSSSGDEEEHIIGNAEVCPTTVPLVLQLVLTMFSITESVHSSTEN